ncbi:MAG TPA: beta-L-arabinofuranosidase domain-containing protein [Chthonomonadaceae bacterium]|nr:beta-L-arabinofuranosidase domain-containing protein [Chthonomonadaceae bacterium]
MQINAAVCFWLASLIALTVIPAAAQQNPAGLARPGTARVADRFTPCPPDAVVFRGGMLGERVAANAANRMLTVDENELLDAFERRTVPHQDWAGEHVGKYLHAATLAWANDRDPRLKAKLDRVVARLLPTQEADGYLGTYMPAKRWTSWDVWVHKYDLLGLLTYYQFTHDLPATEPARSLAERSLDACRKIGDLLIRTFGTAPGQRDINRAGEHVGMAADSVLEPIVLLYRATEDPRYLEFARYIVRNYDAPGGPAILASLEKSGSVRRVANGKAYEMTSNFNGLLELYRVSGDKRLLSDMLTAWGDIVKNRLYLTGSASSGELFQEDFRLPNGNGANICETCVTVTWEQMNLQLLRLTGEARFADEIERSAYNHLLAAQKPGGDDWVYYTPLDGRKQYDAFTTCCHSSGPRGVALLPEIAAMLSDDGGVVVNLYNAGTIAVPLKSGRVRIDVATEYPLGNTVKLSVTPERGGAQFPLRLRIPAWCPRAEVFVNGKRVEAALRIAPGAYCTLDRRWRRGDIVTLEMGIAPRLIIGDHMNEGRAAVAYGPLVLALDAARNLGIGNPARAELAADTVSPLHFRPVVPQKPADPRFVVDGKIAGQPGAVPLTLSTFADAGADGHSRYEVWIARPGHGAAATTASLFQDARTSTSRRGNQDGDINDGDTSTILVTFNNRSANMDWYALEREAPVGIDRVVFAHGRCFHDGGWFDTTAGKPQIQVRSERGGPWKTVATLDTYPATTATDNAGLKDGQKFEARFPAISAVGIRVLGKPSSGDNPAQAFSSCAELQAFFGR